MAEDDTTKEQDGLVSRLRVIEDQPLDARAAAYGQLHEQLRETLEGSDSSATRQHG